ncbi:COX assembly mitochondrial protein homolog [Bradysia coprophila]|uniref:COX assembly mitochondrial protein homolog n=1 Tax=Bradysia coprophila TaxID=38358 RepID=UPI00187D9BE2|nr:COX assembly mitochondrial protein homolog [Bradysia coprophila]
MVVDTQQKDGVLPNRMGGGPHGLGDPDDKQLRKVEKEILVPKIMRERAKETHCAEVVKAFETCCKANNVLMVVNCRAENDALKTCLGRWYKDASFINECTDIYLKERTEYRTSGLTKKQRAKIAAESNGQ